MNSEGIESDNGNAGASATAAPKSRKFKKRWLVWLFLIVLFGPYLFFRATSFSRKIVQVEQALAIEPRQFDGQLSVLTWNIAHGRGATDNNWEEGRQAKEDRVDEIATLITRLSADIVVLNEVDFSATWSGGFDQADAIARAAGYPYYVKQSNLDFGLIYGRWHFGNVIMSHFPISDAQVVELSPVNGWEDWVVGAKRGVTCSVELEPGNLVSVIGVHMESRGEDVRVNQVFDLTNKYSELEYPVFIAGDLNTTPESFPRSNLNRDGKNAFDNLVDPSATGLSFSPLNTPDEAQLTFPSDNPTTLIDWILFDDSFFKLNSQKTIPSLLSDHLPVMGEFEQVKKL